MNIKCSKYINQKTDLHSDLQYFVSSLDRYYYREWTSALRMNVNVTSVRDVYNYRSQDNHSRRCDEIETLSHVMGSCRYNSLMIIASHDTVRSLIANSLRISGARRDTLHRSRWISSSDGRIL